ncbi:Autophagy protein Apg5, helix rich domain domain-containing protein [Trichomonas vaginalis G3]|nr:Autophagy protein Apg5, helix rich domain domain-containing protein [Trichomonas vaginalis G3]KAI5541323.1 Autophagy protein Apg5, helix rich domain domain-containing protein [Trichomonas vaginalis G3]
MGEIAEIKERVFNGTVPVRVSFDKLDIPLFFNVPRCITFGIFFHEKLQSEFGEKCDDFWMTSKGRYIQPNLPAGLIYDSFVEQISQFTILQIDIKTTEFPLQDVLRCPTMLVAQQFFNHSFKESLFLQSGNLSLLTQSSNLPSNILETIINRKYPEFLEFYSQVEKNSSAWKLWPIKVMDRQGKVTNHFLPGDGENTLKDAINADKAIIQGIEVDGNTPIKTLIPTLLYPDGFLYVVV